MKNLQPNTNSETLSTEDTSSVICLPRLSLPQVTPAQVIAKRQHSDTSLVPSLYDNYALQTVTFPQTPVTPPLTEPFGTQASVLQTKKDMSSVSLLSGPQLPFPTPRFDFSHSLRAGVTYIPRSMTRHKEPNMLDALIACGTLVLIGLFILMLLYYFSM